MLLDLLWSFLQVGLFSIGGGLATLPLISGQVVDLHGWLSLGTFSELIAIAEMTPGPIAVNVATFVGMRVAGLPGAVLASVGVVLPGCLIAGLLGRLYARHREQPMIQGVLEGIRPAVVAMIAAGFVTILRSALWQGGMPSLQTTDWIALASFVACLFLLFVWGKKISPALLMLGSGVVGCCLRLLLNG